MSHNNSIMPTGMTCVNDVHSGLNATQVYLHQPTSAQEVCDLVRRASRHGSPLAISGGRHAMGGQQFAEGLDLLDLRGLSRILDLDGDRGLVSVEAGIDWPTLIAGLLDIQRRHHADKTPRWTIAQKQTGADKLTLGGALSANVHGRGLTMKPIVSNVESFTLVGPDAVPRKCSRTENANLFSLVIGGYGLFGIITEVTLRLAPRRTLRRVVRVIDIEDAIPAAARRIEQGFVYGDFQFDIDPRSRDFLTKGVFSCYVPVEEETEPPTGQQQLSRDDWVGLLLLAHTDKSKAFMRYAQHYLATDGQLYHSDSHQLSEYIDAYHDDIDRRTGATCRGSEMITELYVPPEKLVEFLRQAAKFLTRRGTPVIYGTIRLIERDDETFLPWATQRSACIIFNLHVDHTESGIAHVADSFRGLIDIAAALGGSYYLTYHRFATAPQVLRCYPQFREFLEAKRQLDPAGIFQSDWLRHHLRLLAAT